MHADRGSGHVEGGVYTSQADRHPLYNPSPTGQTDAWENITFPPNAVSNKIERRKLEQKRIFAFGSISVSVFSLFTGVINLTSAHANSTKSLVHTTVGVTVFVSDTHSVRLTATLTLKLCSHLPFFIPFIVAPFNGPFFFV